MNKVWIVMMLMGCAAAGITGRGAETSRAVLESGQAAVRLWLTLTGSMALWSGLMEILTETGDMQRFGRIMRRVLRPLFPGLEGEACWSAMGMNVAANIMGLGNAATPAGVEAARLMETQGEAGRRALAMLLALNNSSLQLIPATVMTLRSAAGAANPADIWPATLLSSCAATVAAAVMMRFANRGGDRHD